MDFFTKIKIPKANFSITHQDKILLIGSCFTENIGNYLVQNCFKVNINPFGIIYNPISIFNVIKYIGTSKIYAVEDLLMNNELYLSTDHHGKFSATSSDEILENINSSIYIANKHLQACEYIIITLGTAFVYHHIEQNKTVANCHKLPSAHFQKRILSIAEIKNAFNEIQQYINNKKIIFTVSPVRHWRDGAMENLRSKSILIESIHQLIDEYPNCSYFPAYEIMLDELRDYRFYNEDMLHPNELAVKYIWEKFSATYFHVETTEIIKFIDKGNALFAHKIKHSNTQEHRKLEENKLIYKADFMQKYPNIEFPF
ncbi:MAG TPA: GSCFA domain-containing protein [Chitinophagales bacterium]|nr:GSCFA domain-containing protein [Chitinophagales bacterium]